MEQNDAVCASAFYYYCFTESFTLENVSGKNNFPLKFISIKFSLFGNDDDRGKVSLSKSFSASCFMPRYAIIIIAFALVVCFVHTQNNKANKTLDV